MEGKSSFCLFTGFLLISFISSASGKTETSSIACNGKKKLMTRCYCFLIAMRQIDIESKMLHDKQTNCEELGFKDCSEQECCGSHAVKGGGVDVANFLKAASIVGLCV